MINIPQPRQDKVLTDLDGNRYIWEADAKETFADLTHRLNKAEEVIQYFVDRATDFNHPEGWIQSKKTLARMQFALTVVQTGKEPPPEAPTRPEQPHNTPSSHYERRPL